MTDLYSTQRTGREMRKARAAVHSSVAEPHSNLGSSSICLWSLWMGMVVGLLELGLLFALKPLRDPIPGLFRMNRHALWIVPLDNMIVFSACGCLLAAVAWFSPRRASRCAPRVLGTIAVLTILLTVRPLFVWASVVLSGGLGCLLGGCLSKHSARFHRLVCATLPFFGVAALGVAGTSFYANVIAVRGHGANSFPARSGAPNILLIVLDTVRMDRLSAYGYHRPTTPALERLARRGVRFDWARSTAPWTLPSHASMFTGRWPHQLSAGLDAPLDATYPTVAEFLAGRGYDTAGFVANLTYASAETGLARGFARYDDHGLTPGDLLRGCVLGSRIIWETAVFVGSWMNQPLGIIPRKDAARINAQFLDWLEQRPRERPFFAFLNYFDAHCPYTTPSTYNRHFGVHRESADDDQTLERWFVLNKNTLTPRKIQLVNDSYDDCIAYLDEQLGQLFDRLERDGALDDTVVVITADHGEDFGEHGLYGHASSLYDPEVRVPLIVVGPGRIPAERTIKSPVTLRNLSATIVDLAGENRESPFPGVSLATHWRGPESPATSGDGPLLAEVDKPAFSMPNQGRSPVVRGAMKLLASDRAVYIRNGDSTEELYDLATDPNQLRNRASSPCAQEELEQFRDQLQRLLENEPPSRCGLMKRQD